jgi:N-carbamoyl-L-amino-acid hydrolase
LTETAVDPRKYGIMIEVQGERLLADLRALAEFGKEGTGVNRLSFTPEDLAARDWLIERMQAAGLVAEIDGVGNVYGRSPAQSRAVLIGSHTDTVPSGGWLDGAMGVMYGLEIARASIEAGADAAVGVDVISFADEESTFCGTLGSRSFVGEVGETEIATAHNLEGLALTDALARAGYADRPHARLDRDRHVAYLEAHIEQGPRLEAAATRIGMVTSIVGIRRMEVIFRGQSDHAGTTPMAMRKDAGAALIRYAGAVLDGFDAVGGPDSVWNFGHVIFEPGAGNVVPREARILIEYRDTTMAIMDRMEAVIRGAATAAHAAGAVSVEARPMMAIAPADMDPALGRLMDGAAAELKASAMYMPSGAGHDAQHLANHVPTAMMFIPSIGGRSHDTAENTEEADIVLGLRVLAATVTKIGNQVRS